MSLATTRAAIKAALLSVAGITLVHEFERYAKNLQELAALYAVGNQIDGWNFFTSSWAELDLNSGERRLIHNWRINGYRSWNDTSQSALAFEDQVELIADAFRADPTLGGAVLATQDMDNEFGAAGIQVESIEPVMFAGALCHRAQLRLLTETSVTI